MDPDLRRRCAAHECPNLARPTSRCCGRHRARDLLPPELKGRPPCLFPGCRYPVRKSGRPGASPGNRSHKLCLRHRVRDLPPELRRPVVLCSDGCGRPMVRRGRCQVCHNRWRRASDPEYRRHEQAVQNARRRTSPKAKLDNRRKMNARRARKRGAAGTCSTDQLAARWAMWGGRCWICGAVATTTDHVIPLARGGSNWPANLRPACASCNARKGARTVTRSPWTIPTPHER